MDGGGAMNDLQPCPFCGGTDIKLVQFFLSSAIAVECDCGVVLTPPQVFPTDEQATAAWNTRAEATESAAEWVEYEVEQRVGTGRHQRWVKCGNHRMRRVDKR